MSWNSPITFVAGSILTAAQLNTYLSGNTSALRSGEIALASQAANDVIIAASATQLGRLAMGSALQALRVNAAGNGLEFASVAVKSVQTVSGTIAGGAVTVDVAISAVTTAKAVIVPQFTGDDPNGGGYTFAFTSTTNVRITRPNYGYASGTLSLTVLEWY